LSPSRLAKQIGRSLRVSSREELTQYDIEALDANTQRVGLVIKLRWVLVAALVVFSIVALAIYTVDIPLPELLEKMMIPAGALLFVVGYSAFYTMTYERLGNIAVLNQLQLMFDILVVGVLIHYSGGVYSWAHAMLLLFILEGTFILPRARDAWFLTVFAGLVYSGVIAVGYFGWADPVLMPYIQNNLHHVGPYVSVRALWSLTLMSGVTLIGTIMMSKIRDRERKMSERSMIDHCTSLFNRTYFNSALKTEVARAHRTNTAVGVVLMDITRFKEFNRAFGYKEGDRMLQEVSSGLEDVISQMDGVEQDLDILCRYGGEEFVAIIPEAAMGTGDIFYEKVMKMAEMFRQRTECLRVDDRSVVLSAGVAVYPDDGKTVDDLMVAADQALAVVAEHGGNGVYGARSIQAED